MRTSHSINLRQATLAAQNSSHSSVGRAETSVTLGLLPIRFNQIVYDTIVSQAAAANLEVDSLIESSLVDVSLELGRMPGPDLLQHFNASPILAPLLKVEVNLHAYAWVCLGRLSVILGVDIDAAAQFAVLRKLRRA